MKIIIFTNFDIVKKSKNQSLIKFRIFRSIEVYLKFKYDNLFLFNTYFCISTISKLISGVIVSFKVRLKIWFHNQNTINHKC